jgi:serine/threonine protein kinase
MLLSPSSQNIKLIDFGLSRKLEPGKDNREMMGTPEFVGRYQELNCFYTRTAV